jgi:molybdopterin-guanine dinucleotide biosynthesis protein A
VTVVRDEAGCPHGGQGCGACLISENFVLVEETEATSATNPGKDTSRMRAAGASLVYWLRTKPRYLREGLERIFSNISEDMPVVCESNAVRMELKPSLFLVLKDGGSSTIKPSCEEVISFADATVKFAMNEWDRSPERVEYIDGRWRLFEDNSAAIVLAGGASRRMKAEKSMLEYRGRPMIAGIVEQLQELFSTVLIGANNKERYSFLGLPIIADREPEKGPLMGLLSCLECSSLERNFVTACDIPVMHSSFIRKMLSMAESFDIVMPVNNNGGYEPLYAVYRRNVIPVAQRVLTNGGRRFVDLFRELRVGFVDLPPGDWYKNLNSQSDYLAALDWSKSS